MIDFDISKVLNTQGGTVLVFGVVVVKLIFDYMAKKEPTSVPLSKVLDNLSNNIKEQSSVLQDLKVQTSLHVEVTRGLSDEIKEVKRYQVGKKVAN